MYCKSKEFQTRGFEYNDVERKLKVVDFTVICTNDEGGKTLSVDNGQVQFSIPMDKIAKVFEGDYQK